MDNFYSIQVIVKNRDGIHARPSMLIVEAANKFSSEIFIQKEELRINGKSILGLLTLAASYGTELMVEARGKDAGEAAKTIGNLLSKEFNFAKGQTKQDE